METQTQKPAGGSFVPSIYIDGKGTSHEVTQHASAPPPAELCNRKIPAEFVYTPLTQQSTQRAAYSPSSLANQIPISSNLPVPLAGSGYVRASAPPCVTATACGFDRSSAVFEYVEERQNIKWGPNYEARQSFPNSLATVAVQSARGPLPTDIPEIERSTDYQYSSCPLELQGSTTRWYRMADPLLPEATTTVTRYQMPRSYVPKVLPMKEVEFCTEIHEGRTRPPLQPSVTTYILPSTGKRAKKRNVVLGRSRSICQDWVLSCLDTLFSAISRACNCDVDIVPQPEYAPAVAYSDVPNNGDCVCLSCGETVDSRMLGGAAPSYKTHRLGVTTAKKESEGGGRIPLPTFAYNPYPETSKPVDERESSDPVGRAAQIGKRRSSALGYPTDDEGLVALPAFSLNESK